MKQRLEGNINFPSSYIAAEVQQLQQTSSGTVQLPHIQPRERVFPQGCAACAGKMHRPLTGSECCLSQDMRCWSLPLNHHGKGKSLQTGVDPTPPDLPEGLSQH